MFVTLFHVTVQSLQRLFVGAFILINILKFSLNYVPNKDKNAVRLDCKSYKILLEVIVYEL